MSQYKVHRVRFIDHKHKALNSACFDGKSSRLAVSLEDGSIEIQDADKDFMVDFVVPGQEGRTVEHLAWNQGRLFSGGLNGQIIEWDLTKLSPKYFEDSCGGPIWCLRFNHKGNTLAVGCEDGTVKLFKVMMHGLNYDKSVCKQAGRILSLAWSKDDSKIITGGSESAIKVYSVKNDRITSTISVSDNETRKREDEQETTKVWAIEVVDDFTLVTGDSNGNTQFWDGHTGTLMFGFKSHEADILTLAVKHDEVYASGVDSKIVKFALTFKGTKTWSMIKHIRPSVFDIRALAIFQSPDTEQSYIVAAGMYPALFVTSTDSFAGMSNPVHSYYRQPATDVCQIASDANQIMYRSNKKLNLWQLETTDPVDFKNCEQILELHSDSDDHIHASAISSCGSYLCYSTVQKTKFYQLQSSPLQPKRKYRSLPPLSKMLFTPDSCYMVGATFSKLLYLVDLKSENGIKMNVAKLDINLPFRFLHTSQNSKFICIVDAMSKIFFFEITEDGLVFHSQAPSVSNKIISVAFHQDNSRLFIATSSREIFEYNVKEEKLLPWAQKLTESKVLNQFGPANKSLSQIVFNPDTPDELFLQCYNIFGKLNLNVKIEDEERDTEGEPAAKKIKPSVKASLLKTTRAYRNIIHFSFNSKGEMIVVEIPKSVKEDLPPSLKIKRFKR